MDIMTVGREDMFGKRRAASRRDELLAEINEAARALETAREHFNQADEDMLEACIFEMNAARARYSGLVREYKEGKM